MTVPCREQVLAAIQTILAGISGVAGFTSDSVERDRPEDTPIGDDECPRLVIYEGPQEPQFLFSGQDDYELRVEIHGVALGDDVAAARTVAAVLRAKVEQALLQDVTLGGVAQNVVPSEEMPPALLAIESADRGYGFQAAFNVHYATVQSDPFTFA